MLFVENVIPFLNTELAQNRKVALATLVNVEGSSPRPIGSQIGVSETGDAVGMITGGCAEKAIITEALQCMKEGVNKTVRYGAGSPYLDVVLPCGSGIDVYLETQNCAPIVSAANTALNRRAPVHVEIDYKNGRSLVVASDSATSADAIRKILEPGYRILAFGEGSNLISFCTIANAAGYDIEAHSPDEEALAFLEASEIKVRHIHQSESFGDLGIDAFTAVITLFHEHEWEANILKAALNSDANYIGALGSRKTHEARLENLQDITAPWQPPSVIRGPVGLNIGAQNPNEIALSILSEIVEHRRKET